jgi:uncharacterized membrane protein
VSESVGLAELVSKIAIYYIHERVWNPLPFGKTPEKEMSNTQLRLNKS